MVNWESETGLPVPGKGTMSYNCGEDAIFASGVSIEHHRARELYLEGARHAGTWSRLTRATVASSVAQSVLSTRVRYGGNRWRPEGSAA